MRSRAEQIPGETACVCFALSLMPRGACCHQKRPARVCSRKTAQLGTPTFSTYVNFRYNLFTKYHVFFNILGYVNFNEFGRENV